MELGTVSSQRRLLGSDTPLWPFVDGWDPNPVPARDVLDRLGRTSVATVAMQLPDPLVIDDAQALADVLAPGVSTVWAGFDLAGITDELAVTDPLAMVGASTCSAPLPSAQLFGATSADAGGSFGAAPTSISDALDAVREAVSHVAAHPELAALLPAGWFDTLSVHDDALGASDPTVSMLVVTGPTDVLVEALDTAGAIDAQVLATATYDWIGPICR